MVDRVTVTIRVEQLGLKADMELPCRIPLSQLNPSLLEALNRYTDGRMSRWKGLRLLSGGRALHENGTLADFDVWDGAYVDVVSEG